MEYLPLSFLFLHNLENGDFALTLKCILIKESKLIPILSINNNLFCYPTFSVLFYFIFEIYQFTIWI